MHIPVLLKEAVDLLNLKKGDWAIDATLGDGGHTQEILKRIGSTGRLLALDVDSNNIERAKKRFSRKNLILVNDNFVHLKKILQQEKCGLVQGILMDLGWSMTQFSESGRGFSFQKDEKLDMRLGAGELTAEKILNKWPESEIGRILREYGEKKKWQKISQAIVAYRKYQPIKTTGQLVDLLQPNIYYSRFHPATQVFQALRIAVNDELNVLKQTLPQAVEALAPNGRLAIITFHSLEDRIVKQFFQKFNNKTIKLITKKPLSASAEEVSVNPRSRSAKLRVVEKI